MIVDELKKFEVPIVFLDAEPKDNEFDIVTGEDFESAYRVTQLAIMSGMKNVGFYSSWNQDFFYVLCQEEWYKESPGGFQEFLSVRDSFYLGIQNLNFTKA